MDVKHSRRILILGARDARALDLVHDLTGAAPQAGDGGSIAGLIHEWTAQTAYYTATVPIWIDEMSDVEAWKSGFLEPEAEEVVCEIGAWVYCFRREDHGKISAETMEALRSIQEVIEKHAEYGPDTVKLAVAMPREKGAATTTDGQEENENMCMDCGFEFIDYGATGSNEFGEKLGFERVKEALEANEWADDGDEDGSDFDVDFDDVDAATGGIGREEAEWTAELLDMKAALNDEDGLLDSGNDSAAGSQSKAAAVDSLDSMVVKLLAVREESAGLPEEQRRRVAAKAVKALMKGDRSV